MNSHLTHKNVDRFPWGTRVKWEDKEGIVSVKAFYQRLVDPGNPNSPYVPVLFKGERPNELYRHDPDNNCWFAGISPKKLIIIDNKADDYGNR